jgi:D-alanine-D-alanine ligase
MPLRVAVLHNLRREAAHPGDSGEAAPLDAEYDSRETVEALCATLEACGHPATPVEADASLVEALRRLRPDIAFNIAEGLPGEAREAQAPAVCQLLGIPHTGSGVLALALCLDKAMTKRVLRHEGLPTPAFAVAAPGSEPDTAGLRFPLFVKPLREGTSMGISARSVVADEAELRARVAGVHRAYGEPALVEEFLVGREFTVGVLGNAPPRPLPITEINYGALPPGHPAVYTYQFKKEWDDPRFYLLPAPVPDGLRRELERAAVGAFRALGCLDVARIDLRLDVAGRPQILEVNPLPGLAPGFSDLAKQADAAGLGYRGLVAAILDAAAARAGL